MTVGRGGSSRLAARLSGAGPVVAAAPARRVLALCPFTNVMPILRHDLVGAARAGLELSVDLVMAWVDVTALTVHRSLQRYTTLGPAGDGGALIGFASEGFTATIAVDADGLVVDYPGSATRVVP